MLITKQWAMPSSATFSIKPIKEFVERYLFDEAYIIDPFCGSSNYATITNDLDPDSNALYHMDATKFLRTLPDSVADIVLYDPPYSPRQVSECYKKFGKTVNFETTQSKYWKEQKEEISRIIKPKGVVLSFGWNSGGIGKKYGFEQIEIMLVAHGGAHNDTICVAERKA